MSRQGLDQLALGSALDQFNSTRVLCFEKRKRWSLQTRYRWFAEAISGDGNELSSDRHRNGARLGAPEEFLSERDYHAWMTRGFPRKGDILFTTEAPMGNTAVVRLSERFALAQRVICFRSYGAVNPDFLALQLRAEPFQFILDKTATGLTAKGIKGAKLRRLPVAVPPLAEQLRIVAKVDELMGLCDRLEEQLTSAQSEAGRLLEAVLHQSLAEAT